MRRDVTLALGLRAGGALAWLGYVWLLARTLPPPALGQALYALALAGLLGGLLSAGWAGLILRDGARQTPGPLLRQGLGRVVRHGLLLTGGLCVLAGLGGLPHLSPVWPLAPLTGLAALGLAVLGLLSSAARARGQIGRAMLAQGALKAAFPALALLALLRHWPPGPGLVLAGFCLGLLPLLAGLAWRVLPPAAPRPETRGLRHIWGAQAGTLLLGHLDVVILGWVLSPLEAAGYLLARRLVGLLAMLFDGLRSALAPRLAQAFAVPGAFPPLAARVNLAFLLLGGGAALLLLMAAPLALGLFGPAGLDPATQAAFLWLLLGQAAPALFGATGMLMVMSDMERLRARLVWGLLGLGLPALVLAGGWGAPGLALATATLQLGLAALSALGLALRHGILPGLTALLHTRLRLG